MNWLELKVWLSAGTGISKDALHIYAAVAFQYGTALLLRRSLASVVPWLAVGGVLAINEALDLCLPGQPIEPWQVDGLIHDVWNTMLLPTAILLVALYAPPTATTKVD